MIRTGQADRYHQLLHYLERGWVIDPPVFIRPTWSTRSEQKDTYHFVLKDGEQCLLFSVPTGHAVERFVQEHRLRVNRL